MAIKITRGMFLLSCVVMGLIWTNFLLDYAYRDSSVPIAQSTTMLWYIFGAAAGGIISALVLIGL